MAEAVLIDIDRFLSNHGFDHTRYVDDFRIFGDSRRELSKIHEQLTLYLYQHHRLTLSGEKTDIFESSDFVERKLHNHYAEEKMSIFKSLEIFNPYTEEVEEIEFEVEDEDELLRERVNAVIKKIANYSTLDLGLARSAIRKAKRHSISDIADTILANFAFFAPVISDVILYFEEITTNDSAKDWAPKFAALLKDEVFDCQLVRFWSEWYWSRYSGFMNNKLIRNYIYSTPFVENRSRAAITENDLAWVRAMKTEIFHLGSWERRAVLNAARVLPGDERKHWLKLTIGSSPIQLDRWVAKWVLETA